KMEVIMKTTTRWQDWLILIGGIWLFISPWLFAFGHTNYSWDSFLMGALLIIFSLMALGNKRIWEEWITLIIGVWIFISPWVLGFANAPDSWNFYIVGAAVFILSIWDLSIYSNVNRHQSIPAT
ncbi:MAG TPA: SPW repeat protein, partial [Hanamia sp.]|nr:SPW repeat protein [Hanamia sp.]